MILVWLLVILAVAGALSALAGRLSRKLPRWISLLGIGADFLIGLYLWIGPERAPHGTWVREIDVNWIPSLGIHFHLALDGLSLLLLMLTFALGFISVLVSWREIQHGAGFFHLNLCWTLTGISGVFLAMDLFLFYFAWELMLIPMFFLIAIWGHQKRIYAAVKFLLFSQLSGLLMLIAILALYFEHHAATGVYTFEYRALLHTPLSPAAAMWIMLGFFAAFLVKLPGFPLHTWAPDAYTHAPTAGSIIVAGIMAKTAAYGLLRFILPLFPGAAHAFASWGMVLGAIGILYGALLAFGQTDLKRLIAYTSVGHMGFVLMGTFAAAAASANGMPATAHLALVGVVLEIVCHGFSTGGLFAIAGSVEERLRTREMSKMNGLWAINPRLGGTGLFFVLAAIGLPGLGNFVAEFLILVGTFHVGVGFAIVGALGILFSTFYGIELVQRVFHGPNRHGWQAPDMRKREAIAMVPMMAVLLWLGLYPQPVINAATPALAEIESSFTAVPGTQPQNAVPQPVVGALDSRLPQPAPATREALPPEPGRGHAAAVSREAL